MFTEYDIDSLRDYEAKGLITAREHPDLPLVVWNYTAETQYGRLWDETTLSTRGVVTDLQGNTVAQCIPKFFNLAETDYEVSDFDVAYEKLDGSLIHVFWYDGQWVCSSRGSFESDHAGWAQELVDKNVNYFKKWETAVPIVFVCELIIPKNRIVVDYGDEESLRLITTFMQIGSDWVEISADRIKTWPWDTVEEIPMEALPTYLDQSGIEGVVLVGEENGETIRVKIKTDEYVEHHRIVTGLTTKNVLEHYIEHGNVDKLLEVAPDEWYDRIGQLAWNFQTMVDLKKTGIRWQFGNVMNSLPHDHTRKDFAILVKGQRNAPYLFKLLDDRDITEMVQHNLLDNYEEHGLEL